MVKQENPHAVALGRAGGRKNGKARLEKLTPEQRQEIAQKAIQTRWAKAKKLKSRRAEAGFLNGCAAHRSSGESRFSAFVLACDQIDERSM
jgi:hypothetical protein